MADSPNPPNIVIIISDDMGYADVPATGFRNAAHFFRMMKRLTGRTPGGRRGWKVSG